MAYPNHSFRTCSGPEAFASTTIFGKCNGKTSSGGQKVKLGRLIPSETRLHCIILYLV